MFDIVVDVTSKDGALYQFCQLTQVKNHGTESGDSSLLSSTQASKEVKSPEPGEKNISVARIHLFRRPIASSIASHDRSQPTKPSSNLAEITGSEQAGGSTVCVLSIPSWVTARSLFRFNSISFQSVGECWRLFDSWTGQCSLIIRFSNQSAARAFADAANGSRFHDPLSPEVYDEATTDNQSQRGNFIGVCVVLPVATVCFTHARSPADGTISDRKNIDVDGRSVDQNGAAFLSQIEFSQMNARANAEVPSCLRCLSRLDSTVTGVVTPGLFAWRCPISSRPASPFEKCNPSEDASGQTVNYQIKCKVCELVDMPLMTKKTLELAALPISESKSEAEAKDVDVEKFNHKSLSRISAFQIIKCAVCSFSPPSNTGSVSMADALWVCCLCGNMGCGRYNKKHARAHFEETGHRYSLDLYNQVIWDYVGDVFVHRIDNSQFSELTSSWTRNHTFKNGNETGREDRKLGRHLFRGDDEDEQDDLFGDDELQQNMMAMKLLSVSAYYEDLLTDQLRQQQGHFENKLVQLDFATGESVANIERQTRKAQSSHQGILRLTEEISRQESSVSQKLQSFRSRLDELQSENKFMHDLNMSLLTDQGGNTAEKMESDRLPDDRPTDASNPRLQSKTLKSKQKKFLRLMQEKLRREAQLRTQIEQLYAKLSISKS